MTSDETTRQAARVIGSVMSRWDMHGTPLRMAPMSARPDTICGPLCPFRGCHDCPHPGTETTTQINTGDRK